MKIYELLIGSRCSVILMGRIWCTDGSFIRPEGFIRSGKTAFGYMLSNDIAVKLKKCSADGFNESLDKIDKTECHMGIKGYMPDIGRLRILFQSIMAGTMRNHLITARIYNQCSYRSQLSFDYEYGWGTMWSSTKSSKSHSYCLNSMGSIIENINLICNSSIPFYNINDTI